MLENLGKRKIIEAMVLATALALPTSMVVNNQSETALAVQQRSSTHQRSVQKLYADFYDQDTGQKLGRYLVDTEYGYTDSPHRMFDNSHFPDPPAGYAYIANMGPISIDWKNPSGITDVQLYVVKKTSKTYKDFMKSQEGIYNDDDEDKPKVRYNEDGLRVDPDGSVDLHDLLHRYRSFLGVPCPGDGIDESASPHLIYLFKKYFGYDPNKSKQENAEPIMHPKVSKDGQQAKNKAKSSSKKKSNKKKSSKKNKNKATKKKHEKSKAKADIPLIVGSGTALAVGIGAVTWGIVKIKKLHK